MVMRFLVFVVAVFLVHHLVSSYFSHSSALALADPVPSSPASSLRSQARLEAAVGAVHIIQEGADRMRPQWETIQPKPKDECLKLSGGSLNPVFVRCHYGYQEQVSYDAKGNRKVYQERSIPMNLPR